MARVDYDRMAPDYVEGRALPPEGMEPWREAIRPWLPAGAGRSPVLDLGAGTGQFAAAIAGWFGVEVVAVEPSRGMRAQAAVAHPHPGVAWVAGAGERLPLGGGTCAWAWVSTVVHHLDDLDAVAARAGAGAGTGRAGPGPAGLPRADGGDHPVRRFFPGVAAALVAGGWWPTVERVSEAFAGAGFRVEGLAAVDQVSATSLAAYRDKVRRRADTGLGCCPTTSSPPAWPPSTARPTPRPTHPGGRPHRPAGPGPSGPSVLAGRAVLVEGDVGQGPDERRRGVHQLDPVEGQAGLGGLLAGGDVDVVEDLQVVGQELHGHHQHRRVAVVPQAGEQVLEVGLEPLLGAVAGRLVGELPAAPVEAGPLDHGVDRLGDLVQVAGVAVDHRLGQAVGGEHHRHLRGRAGRGPR